MKSWVEVSGGRLAANFRAVQGVAGADAEVLAVVKADAYGHGATLCAPVLRDAGAKWLGVTDIAEGVAVRAVLGAKAEPTRIVVMCGMEPGDAVAMVAHQLTPVVWTAAHVRALEAEGQRLGRKIRVHLEVDTGMGRQGAALGVELREVVASLAMAEWVICEGVMTHLCCSEVAGAVTTAVAEERFDMGLKEVVGAGLEPRFVHVANTSAVDEGGMAEWVRTRAAEVGARVMVRTGIALYGYCLALERSRGGVGESGRLPAQAIPHPFAKARKDGPPEVEAGAGVRGGAGVDGGRTASSAARPHQREDFESRDGDIAAGLLGERVRPVMTWRAPVIGLRDVAAGATIGYGATFLARWAMRLALLPVGYADGLRREASSGKGDGWVMIHGKLAAVVGRVSMNLTVVDVSGIDTVRVGSEAVLLGEGVSAEDHATWSETIPYDILCGVRAQRFLR